VQAQSPAPFHRRYASLSCLVRGRRSGACGPTPTTSCGPAQAPLCCSRSGWFHPRVVLPPIGSEDDRATSSKPLASGDKQPASMIPRSTTPAGAAVHRDVRKDAREPENGQADRAAGRVSVKKTERPRESKISEPASPPPIARSRVAREATRVRVPTRLFVWLPSRRASYYRVRFLKGTRTIFEAWPTDPRVSVPLRGAFRGRSFAFTNGRYRWIVRPAFGRRSEGRYREPIVRSIWLVRS
jgi:hypothetical protein